MSFDLRIDRRVIKELAGFEAKIFRLSQDPCPHDSEELRGYRDPEVPGRKGFRVDQGEYRILYTMNSVDQVVTIFRVGHRREVYR